jgi:hypothetical protein
MGFKMLVLPCVFVYVYMFYNVSYLPFMYVSLVNVIFIWNQQLKRTKLNINIQSMKVKCIMDLIW